MSFLRNFTYRPALAKLSRAALLKARLLIAALSLTVGLEVVLQTAALAASTSDDKPATALDTPSIVVSIKPLHSLVSAVTRDVTAPVLLFDGFSSPHTAQLKPSMMRQLRNADLLVWVGSGVEVFLGRVVTDLNPRSGVVAFGEIDGLRRLPFRFDQHGHGHKEHTRDTQSDGEASEANHEADNDTDHADQIDNVDYHFWLDPDNAQQLVGHLSEYLARIDPANAQLYKDNAEQMSSRLNQLDQQLELILADLADVPYLVFHDSFQYLEKRYGLHRALVIAEQPEVQPGARRLKQILQRVESQNVKCLFTEPQFPARVLSMLQRDSSVDVATLDPLASRYDAGPELYADWLLELGQTVRDCLTR